jgi:hypothetical protein
VLKFSEKKEPKKPPINNSNITILNFVKISLKLFLVNLNIAKKTNDSLPNVKGNPGIEKVKKGIPLTSNKNKIKSKPEKKLIGDLNIIKKLFNGVLIL